MSKDNLNYIEATFLVTIIMVSHVILDIPNAILTSNSSSAPLNVIYITILTLVFFFVVHKLFEPFHNKDIIDVAEYAGGNSLKKVVSIIYSLHLIFIAGISILSFADTLKAIYLQDMPTWLICLVFILIAIIANLFEFKNISKLTAMLIPFILLSIIIIFLALSGDYVPQRIFPILGYGAKQTFLTGASNIFAFGGLILLFLVKPQLKSPKDYKKIGISSILISGIFLFLAITSLLLLYPFATGREGVLSIYMMTRSIQFGKFFQRTDALFILIWVLTFFCYLSVVLGYILRITKKSIATKKNSPIIYLIALGIFIVTLIPQNVYQIRLCENVIYKYSALLVVFLLSFSILLVGYLKKRKEQGIVKISERNVTDES